MLSQSSYCAVCGGHQEFHDENRSMTLNVRGEDIEVSFPVRICHNCETELAVNGADPVDLAYSIYRRKKGLLEPADIVAIRQKYGLTQRSLARLIGMSEATLNRYEKGAIQDTTHDTVLRAFDNQEVLLEALGRRGHLLSRDQLDIARGAIGAKPKPRRKEVSVSTEFVTVHEYILETGSTWGYGKAQRLEI